MNIKKHNNIKSILKTVVGIAFIITMFGMTACTFVNPKEKGETGAFESMTTYYGDYRIEVNAKNPGHPEGDSIFVTYFHWYDKQNFKTDVRVHFYFISNPLSEDYNNLDHEIEVGGKNCYYVSDSDTEISLLYEVDEETYLKIELIALNRFDLTTGDSAELDIKLEDSFQSEEFQNAFSFTVKK